MSKGHRSQLIQLLQNRHVTIASIIMEKDYVAGVEFSLFNIDPDFRKWIFDVLPILSTEIELVISQNNLTIRCLFSSINYSQLQGCRTENDFDLAKQLIDQTRQVLIDLLDLKGKGR